MICVILSEPWLKVFPEERPIQLKTDAAPWIKLEGSLKDQFVIPSGDL